MVAATVIPMLLASVGGVAQVNPDEHAGMLQFKQHEVLEEQEVDAACGLVVLEGISEEQKHDAAFLFNLLLPKCQAANVRLQTCEVLLRDVLEDWSFPASCPQLQDLVDAYEDRTQKVSTGALMRIKGKCVSADASRQVIAQDCDISGADHRQVWSIDNNSRIVNSKTLSDMVRGVMPGCLDIYHSRCHNGASVVLHECGEQAWQKWFQQPNGRLESQHCRGKCLDIYQNGEAKIYECHQGVAPQQKLDWQAVEIAVSDQIDLLLAGARKPPCMNLVGTSSQPDPLQMWNRSYMRIFFQSQCNQAHSVRPGTCDTVFEDVFDASWKYPDSCQLLEDLVALHLDHTQFSITQALMQRGKAQQHVGHNSVNEALKDKPKLCRRVSEARGCLQQDVDATHARKRKRAMWIFGGIILALTVLVTCVVPVLAGGFAAIATSLAGVVPGTAAAAGVAATSTTYTLAGLTFASTAAAGVAVEVACNAAIALLTAGTIALDIAAPALLQNLQNLTGAEQPLMIEGH